MFAALFVLATSTSSLMTMRVSPHTAFAPATVTIDIRLTPTDEMRSLEIIVDNGENSTSSEISLEGTKSRKAYQRTFTSIPQGTYAVMAILKGSEGQIMAVESTELDIVVNGPVMNLFEA